MNFVGGAQVCAPLLIGEDMFQTIIINIITQLIYFVGFIFLVGFLISLLNRLFYIIVKQKKAVCYATGFIGTPIHELSHALFCLIFFHKIEEIKLFQMDDKNGVLGYVNHSYNKKNIYQLIGNYFIGIAPIICGTIILYFATRFLLPTAFGEIGEYLSDLALLQAKGLSWNWFPYIFATLGGMIKAIFVDITSGFGWWIYILIVFCIALHMNLSGADIKGSLLGLPFVILVIAAINFILGFVWQFGYISFVGFMNLAGSYLMGTLLLSLIFSSFCIVIGGMIRGGMSLIDAIKRLKK